MAAIQPSTWHTLGLGVATSFTGLGLTALLSPYRTADLFGFHAALGGNTRDLPAMMSLIAARDLSLAITLFSLARAGLRREMGTLILSVMVVCATDIYVAWRRDKWPTLGLFAVGTAIWGAIGLGLRGFFG